MNNTKNNEQGRKKYHDSYKDQFNVVGSYEPHLVKESNGHRLCPSISTTTSTTITTTADLILSSSLLRKITFAVPTCGEDFATTNFSLFILMIYIFFSLYK